MVLEQMQVKFSLNNSLTFSCIYKYAVNFYLLFLHQ